MPPGIQENTEGGRWFDSETIDHPNDCTSSGWASWTLVRRNAVDQGQAWAGRIYDGALIPDTTIVYRGQLHPELSRIEFLVEAVGRASATSRFIYLAPEGAASREEVDEFAARFPAMTGVHYISAHRGSQRSTRAEFRNVITETGMDPAGVIAVGFSSAGFVPVRRCLAWCVNGIPEERLLHGASLVRRAAVAGAWAVAGATIRPQVSVAVSDPMAHLIARRTRTRAVSIPNAVDRSIYKPNQDADRTFLTYQGGGSPWQGLDRLATVWNALHERDRSLRFRVISQDPRTKVLAAGIAPEAIEMVSAANAEEVASYLAEARLGFLYREPNVVNRVSWPMKLGEYLAAGAPMVVSRCGWDAEKVVSKNGAGLVVDWAAAPGRIADQIIAFLERSPHEIAERVAAAAQSLDWEDWCEQLSSELAATYHATSPTPGDAHG